MLDNVLALSAYLFTELFQELFRQDLLVASLFRNFLLAERIMRSYNCTPLSQPQLPPTYHHPLWDSWDMALDHCLSQLRGIVEGTATYQVRNESCDKTRYALLSILKLYSAL